MKAFIDYINEDFAVINLEDGEADLKLPRQLLPAGAREGKWLDISITLDYEVAKKHEKKILKALDELMLKEK